MDTRGLDLDSPYWICAYANRQHDLGQDIVCDPMQTSFFKAMQLAAGVVIVLNAADRKAKP